MACCVFSQLNVDKSYMSFYWQKHAFRVHLRLSSADNANRNVKRSNRKPSNMTRKELKGRKKSTSINTNVYLFQFPTCILLIADGSSQRKYMFVFNFNQIIF